MEFIRNIKDAFLTDYDVKVLLKNGFENRNITKDELTKIKSLYKITHLYNSDFFMNIIKVPGNYYMSKIYDAIWAIYLLDENKNIVDCTAFRDLDSACIYMINEKCGMPKSTLDRFFDIVNFGYTDLELNLFANRYNYNIINEKKKILKK